MILHYIHFNIMLYFSLRYLIRISCFGILYCIVLSYEIFYFIKFHYIFFLNTILYCIILYDCILSCLYYIVLCNTKQYSKIQCNIMYIIQHDIYDNISYDIR